MLLKLMDLKLLKNGYMKKFFKTLGSIIAIPLSVLLIMYGIPAFLLNYFINILNSKIKETNEYYKNLWKVVKFSWNNILCGNKIMTRSIYYVSNGKETMGVTKKNYY